VAKVRNEKDRLRKTKPIFVKFDGPRIAFPAEWTPVGVKKRVKYATERLLAILLDSGGAQSGKAMLIDRELPG
jgi:hypothetical protein